MQILDMVVANSVCLAENGQTKDVTKVKLSTTEPQLKCSLRNIQIAPSEYKQYFCLKCPSLIEFQYA